MRERAEMLGRELRVERPPEGGTVVELRVPLRNAMAQPTRERPVVILDHELPDGDGADLIEDLHDHDPRIQTLVLSAHADPASVARGVQVGAAAVLGKTTHLHNVVSGVRRARAGETLMRLDEVVDLLRFAGRLRERELDERRRVR